MTPKPKNSSDTSLNEVISRIQTHTEYQAVKTHLVPYLNQLNEQVFSTRSPTLPDPLDVLSAEGNSLAYLHFLAFRCKTSNGMTPGLMQKVWTFVNVCNSQQVQLAADRAMIFAEGLVKIAMDVGQPIMAVKPLAVFVQRLQTSPGQLTMLHPLLAKTSLLAQSYRDILPILDQDIADVDPTETKINYQDVLLYHYYGGMIYAALKQFDRSIEFFKLTISAPATVASAIQLEAYKKFVLTNLIHLGRLQPLPKYTATAVIRALKARCAAYTDFASVYEKKSVSTVKSELEKVKSVLGQDRNLGLAKQSVEALNRRNIQDLTRTYLTLSLQDISNQIGLGTGAEAVGKVEGIIVGMIESGEIFAKISHAGTTAGSDKSGGGMVSFLDDPNGHASTVTMDMIQGQIEKAKEMSKKLQEMDQTIATMPQFYAKGGRGGGRGDGGDGPSLAHMSGGGFRGDPGDYDMGMSMGNYGYDEESFAA